MQDLIASYLVQKKECSLPLLGHFIIKSKPAQLDIANKQIFPPADEILFNENGDYLTEDLTAYVSNLWTISQDEAEEKITNWCLHAKAKLDSGEKIIFDSIGSLQKNAAGTIFFQRKKGIKFYEPVSAERVIHKDAEHAVLVGDRETTSGVINEYYKEEEITEGKSHWRIWAIVMLALSLLVLLFYFSTHNFSGRGTGNRTSIPVQDPPATYYTPQ